MDTVDESISQIMEKRVEVDTIVFPERISERTCEQSGIINVTERRQAKTRKLQLTVQQMLDDSVDVVRSVSHGQVQRQTAEHVVDEPLPQTWKFWKVCVLGAGS